MGATSPQVFDETYAAILRARKRDYVHTAGESTRIDQHGAATIAMHGWPGWPSNLDSSEPIIETYVAGHDSVTATSDNEPFVSARLPLITWLNHTVRDALASHGVELDGDAYATASLTATELLEGTAHMDDDTFVPDESARVVAIVGELVGPRVAIGSLTPQPLRPMSQVIWSATQLADFEGDSFDHCACAADQLVVFPQFGQLHAGPAAKHVAELASHRQLLVYRASVV